MFVWNRMEGKGREGKGRKGEILLTYFNGSNAKATWLENNSDAACSNTFAETTHHSTSHQHVLHLFFLLLLLLPSSFFFLSFFFGFPVRRTNFETNEEHASKDYRLLLASYAFPHLMHSLFRVFRGRISCDCASDKLMRMPLSLFTWKAIGTNIIIRACLAFPSLTGI